MPSETIEVQNVKCQGCVATIRTELAKLEGIDDVQVDLPSGRVTISGNLPPRSSVTQRLAELGYPEKTT